MISDRPIHKYIVEKLRDNGSLSLPDTLILLVEVRRYIEENHLENVYSVAKFYCDWACHSSLDVNRLAESALNEINEKLRDSLLVYRDTINYFQTIIDAIKYKEAGKQFELIISAIIHKQFIADNHFMQNIIRCIIGIPIVEKNSTKSEEKRAQVDDYINKQVEKLIKKSPSTILYNMLVHIESNRRMTNFMFTSVGDNGTYNWQIECSDDSIYEGYIKIG